MTYFTCSHRVPSNESTVCVCRGDVLENMKIALNGALHNSAVAVSSTRVDTQFTCYFKQFNASAEHARTHHSSLMYVQFN